jgi:hypothetical protein
VTFRVRLRRLEDYSGGVCHECGHDPSATVRYRIMWEGDPDAPRESLPPCRRCGNQSMIVLSWPDLPKDPLTFDRSGVADYAPQSWDGEGGGGAMT